MQGVICSSAYSEYYNDQRIELESQIDSFVLNENPKEAISVGIENPIIKELFKQHPDLILDLLVFKNKYNKECKQDNKKKDWSKRLHISTNLLIIS